MLNCFLSHILTEFLLGEIFYRLILNSQVLRQINTKKFAFTLVLDANSFIFAPLKFLA
ncbi:hypothetical protein MED121_18690 [Marinomonas sp. MED121]|nr:hypothetical protein MED121_18690 [Marinomonas sp. MED121]